jgi:hypothetical protein
MKNEKSVVSGYISNDCNNLRNSIFQFSSFHSKECCFPREKQHVSTRNWQAGFVIRGPRSFVSKCVFTANAFRRSIVKWSAKQILSAEN